jgi:hypothetical protein
MDRGTLHIAVTDGPDLGQPALTLRIVGRNAAILGDADDLADVIVRLLHQCAKAAAVARGDEERACAVEDEARAEMLAAVVAGCWRKMTLTS